MTEPRTLRGVDSTRADTTAWPAEPGARYTTNDEPAARPVTVVGLGAMGSAVATATLRAGHPTTVWNRSADKAKVLADAGATSATALEAAVRASPLVLACVSDAAALHSALQPVVDALAGRVLVNLTSGTPEEMRATAAWATDRGIQYVDGKILALPSTIGTPHAFTLFSGDSDAFVEHAPTLDALGATSFVGTDPGLATLYDLGLLGLMYGATTGFLHALALLRAEGMDTAAFAPFATQFAAGLPAMLAGIASQVQSGTYGPGEASLDMQVAYLKHMVQVSDARGVDPGLPRYITSVVERALAAGHGGDDMARLVEHLATPPGTSAPNGT